MKIQASIYAAMLLLLFAFSTNAQQFLTPIDNMAIGKACKLQTVDGQTIEGKISGALFIKRMLRSCTIKDAAGEKHKFKSDQIANMEIKIGKLAQLNAAMETSQQKGDHSEIMNREWMTMEQALLPKKKNKYRLLQLLNPDFDQALKVYQDPNAKKTIGLGVAGMNLVGGNEKSYLVVKDGQKAILVKKKKYKKQFKTLFGDHPELMKLTETGKVKFKDFATHAYQYSQALAAK